MNDGLKMVWKPVWSVCGWIDLLTHSWFI